MKTLVLDQTHKPIEFVCWKKAVIYFILGKGEVLEYYQVFICSPNVKILLPKVIQMPCIGVKPEVKLNRWSVFHRDEYRCAYCGIVYNERELTLDHILPRRIFLP